MLKSRLELLNVGCVVARLCEDEHLLELRLQDLLAQVDAMRRALAQARRDLGDFRTQHAADLRELGTLCRI